MKINLKATNLVLTPAIEKYLKEKIKMVEKYLGALKVTACDVELALTTHHHNKGEIFKAEINLAVPGDLLRISKTESDLYKAIDKAKDHLVEVIKKHKGKEKAKSRKTIIKAS